VLTGKQVLQEKNKMGKELLAIEVGEVLPASPWMCIDQAKINEFANATGDKQWIHVDPVRCASESPFLTTIAHGFLSTALMPDVFYPMISLDSSKQTLLNYGMDKLRFLEPVRVNDEIRYKVKLESKEQKNTGVLFRFACEVEIKNRLKPAMIGTFLSLLISA
jgi:acyl dehydratase